MGTPESFIHEQTAGIRTEVMKGLMRCFQDEIQLVRFPVQCATGDVPAGPLPVLGGSVPSEPLVQGKDLPARHYGITHTVGKEGPTYTIETFLPHADPTREQGRSRFILTPESGIAIVGAYDADAMGRARYNRLCACMADIVFSKTETLRAEADLAAAGRLMGQQKTLATPQAVRRAAKRAAFGAALTRAVDRFGDIPPAAFGR